MFAILLYKHIRVHCSEEKLKRIITMGIFDTSQGTNMYNNMRGAGQDIRNLNASLNDANASIRYANSLIAAKNDEIAALRKEVENFRLQAILNLAGEEGFKAAYTAMKQTHPNSAMLADTGKRFKKSGNPKTKATLIYEAAFDRIITNHQIANPETYRAD